MITASNTRLNPAEHRWMNSAEGARIFRALRDAGGEARFVGGAVRNALLGEHVSDIDIATNLRPKDAMTALQAEGIKVIPTGIEHGTITAIVNRHPFEVTSLRQDISTDGRRATVAFTDDWVEDAARRDFTMNAIYADETGALFDSTGGISDLKAGRVKFVGDPNARIREDYLRILRFFRFHAWYGRGAPNRAAIIAAAANKAGLERLSGERIQKELLRMLEASNPGPALNAMQAHNILGEILPAPINLERFSNLVAIAERQNIMRSAIVSLAALLPSPQAAQAIALKLRFSNTDREQLVELLSDYPKIMPPHSAADVTELLYRVGKERLSTLALLGWAEAPIDSVWEPILRRARAWTEPQFPIDGRDAMEAGVAEGPIVGQILAKLEQWWIEENFVPDRAALLAKLGQLLSSETVQTGDQDGR